MYIFGTIVKLWTSVKFHAKISGKILTPGVVQNLASEIIFSSDELDIILNRKNLEICEHSSFFNYWTKFSRPMVLIDINWTASI